MALHRLRVEVVAAVQLPAVDGKTADPYIVVSELEVPQVKYGDDEFKTEVVKKSLSPKWNYVVNINYNKADGPHSLRFEVWDYNKVLKNVLMGVVDVNLEELPLASPVDRWYPFSSAAKGNKAAALHLKLLLLPPLTETRVTEQTSVQVVKLPPGISAQEYARQMAVAQQQQTWQQQQQQQLQQWQQQQQWHQQQPQQWQQQQPQQWQQQQPQQWQQQQPQHWQQQQCWGPQAQQDPDWQRQQAQQHLAGQLQVQQLQPTEQQLASRPGVPDASRKSSSSSSSSSSDSDVDNKKKKKKDKKKKRSEKPTVQAEPVQLLEIKQVLPQLQFGEISKALARHNNNKEEALKELVVLVASRTPSKKDEA